MSEYDAALGSIFRYLRERAKLKQAELGARIGKGQVWISRIERGLLSPALSDLYKLGEALDVAPHQAVRAAEGLLYHLGEPDHG